MPKPKLAKDESPKHDPLAERRERRSLAGLRSEREDLLRRLEEAEARNAFLREVSAPCPPLVIKPRERTARGKREGTAFAMASDWHVEETVTLEGSGFRNEYNLTIADARVTKFFEAVRWLVEAEREKFAIHDMVLWLGGDLITGFIHEELRESNGLHPVEAVLWLKQRLQSRIRWLVKVLDVHAIIPCDPGNHGRTTIKPSIKTYAKNSYEWLLYALLADDFENDPIYGRRVRFNASQATHHFTDVYDYCLHTHHGDDIKFQGGIGGLSIPLNKRVFKWNKAFCGGPNRKPMTYHAIGHWHQRLDTGDTLVNGSLIGYSDYSVRIGADYEPPQQQFCILDSRHGKTAVSPLWVADKIAAVAA